MGLLGNRFLRKRTLALPEFDPLVRSDAKLVLCGVEPLEDVFSGRWRGPFRGLLFLGEQRVDGGLFRDLRLDLHEASVDAVGGQQFGVRALLHELAAVEGQDPVGIAEGGEPVGDGDRGATLDEHGERLLNALLGLGVDVARRLVEHEDPRIVEQRSRDREPLLLAAGEARAVLAEERLVGKWLAAEEVVCAGGLRGLESLPDRRLRPAVGEVFPDRAAEEKRILEDDAEPFPKLLRREVADVDAVDLDLPFLHVVKPAKQVYERRLAGARAAHDADHLPRRHIKRHIPQHRLVAVVAEGDVVEADRAGHVVPGDGCFRLGDRDRRVEQFEHPLAAGEKARQPGREVGEGAQRRVKHRQVGEKRDQLAERHLAADHVAAADIPNDQPAEPEDQLHRGGVGRIRLLHPEPPVAEVVAGGLEAFALPRLLREGLHDANAREHAGERGHLFAGGVPEPVVPRVDVPPEDPRAEDHQRHGDERVERELRIDPDEHRPHADELHDLQEEAAGELVHQSMQDLAVVGHAADHRAHLVAVVVGDREVLELGHHLGAQGAREPRADRRGEPSLEHAHDREHDAGEGEREHHHQQGGLEVRKRAGGRRRVGPFGGEDVVHHVLLELGRDEFGRHAQERQQAEQDRAPRVGREQFPHPLEDSSLLHAPRAGLLAGGEPQAAGGAPRRVEEIVAVERGAARHARGVGLDERLGLLGDAVLRLLERPRHLVKPRGQGV